MAVMPSPCNVTFSRRLSIRDSRLICAPQSFSNVSHPLASREPPVYSSGTNNRLQIFHGIVKDAPSIFHIFFTCSLAQKLLLNFVQSVGRRCASPARFYSRQTGRRTV